MYKVNNLSKQKDRLSALLFNFVLKKVRDGGINSKGTISNNIHKCISSVDLKTIIEKLRNIHRDKIEIKRIIQECRTTARKWCF